MPAERRWYKLTRENIGKISKDRIGAYWLGNKNKTPLRPGSGNLRSRLTSHLINKFPSAVYFKFAYANSIEEAHRMERETFFKNIRKHPRITRHVKRIPRERKSIFD